MKVLGLLLKLSFNIMLDKKTNIIDIIMAQIVDDSFDVDK